LTTGVRIAALGLLLAGLASCSPLVGEGMTGEPGTVLAVSGEPAWTIDLHLSGGLAGRDQQLAVSSAGFFKLSDHRLGLSRQGQLSRELREKITGLLAGLPAAERTGPAGLPNSRCRDCLVFQLDWRSSGKPRTVRVSSDLLSRSPYRELISNLMTIINETGRPDEGS